MVPSTKEAVHQPIEADPELFGESDSGLGDEESRYTASLTSSIERYTVENGRRYHAYKDGSYPMPNDDSELDRLDLTHQMLRILMRDKLYFAPISTDKPIKVLDIGTGTGIWAIELGDELPLAEIVGIDLSPTQSSWVPPNVKFEVDDCEEPWTFQQPFDFIHSRYMAAAIKDWPKLARQCFEHTTPGGYCEFQDFDLQYYSEDGSMTPEAPITDWVNTLLKASRDFGNDPHPGSKLGGWLEDAGFVDVRAEKFLVPIGPWAKDKHLKTLGSWNLVQIEDGVEGFSIRLYTQFLGWKAEEVQVLLAKVRKDLRNPRIHMMYQFWVAYGRKPGSPKHEETTETEPTAVPSSETA